jgi:hypothetical protein
MIRLSIGAVLRFMNSLKVLGSSTGRSADLASVRSVSRYGHDVREHGPRRRQIDVVPSRWAFTALSDPPMPWGKVSSPPPFRRST